MEELCELATKLVSVDPEQRGSLQDVLKVPGVAHYVQEAKVDGFKKVRPKLTKSMSHDDKLMFEVVMKKVESSRLKIK